MFFESYPAQFTGRGHRGYGDLVDIFLVKLHEAGKMDFEHFDRLLNFPFFDMLQDIRVFAKGFVRMAGLPGDPGTQCGGFT